MTVKDLIEKWSGTAGGAETSNFQSFVTDLTEVLGIERPGVAEKGKLGAYEYEASVPGGSFRSTKGTGSVDLYKRGHFIMEAKQSWIKQSDAPLFEGTDDKPQAPSGARYDLMMRDAWLQARNYARNLPSNEPVAPFLVVCDVGRAFELYVDPAGNGRDYEFFPDRQTYRIELADLASEAEVAQTGKTPLELIRAIWEAPKSVDPRFQSALVTRTVASNLAEVSKYLEEGIRIRTEDPRQRAIEIEESSLFLMRVLFCMFAEDIGLLPTRSFEEFLKEAEGNDGYFANGLRDLFEKMNSADPGNRFSMALKTDVRYFNGGLFEDSKTYPLGGFLVHNLYEAARQNWRRVEPAIFGTLLEQALDAGERAKLGAHYTPRPYVDRLVRATIMDVLEPEWEALQAEHEGDEPALLEAALGFHEKLATTRVLDPACGTGNFLYVAMELLQALEARVIELVQKLGGEVQPRVGPQQFYGLELNPRAAKIAELVLWIGWLRNRLRDDPDAVPEPVLQRSANLNMGRRGRYDAVLRLTETGQPDFENPVMAEWPEVDFIIGNPPFIGGKDLREKLGGDYAEAMWKANSRVPKSADFVMQWWDRAAHTLVADGSPLKRFGFVTTNSITQEFSRRVIAQYLLPSSSEEGPGVVEKAEVREKPGKAPGQHHPPTPSSKEDGDNALSLILAIPDHPWTKATKDAAAVRIAMTVAERGAGEGSLREVTGESALDSDNPDIALSRVGGRINANLTVGADVTSAKPLLANESLASPGVKLHGSGFIVTELQAKELGLGKREGLEKHIRPYRNGRDLLQHSRNVMVIDLLGLTEKEVRQRYPEVYEHLLREVKPDRDKNRRDSYKKNWWIFGEPRRDLRPALQGLSRYTATVETSKHRVFQFLNTSIVPDNMLVAIGSDDAYHLGVLQSRIHVEWSLRAGGMLEDRPRYNKSKIFDPFPFPDASDTQREAIADLAEELDETRKLAIAETDKLTMTELYNLREKLRSGAELSDKDRRRATEARAGIVDRLHEQLDAAVADAYGWGEEWAAGQLGPSEIVARLVALNHERAAEEAEGHIRWLRPDYQIPRFAPDKD